MSELLPAEQQDLVEWAIGKAHEARRCSYDFGFGWATQVLANEVQILRDELSRARRAADVPAKQESPRPCNFDNYSDGSSR